MSEKVLTTDRSSPLTDAEDTIRCAYTNIVKTADILNSRGYFKLAVTLHQEGEKIRETQQWINDEINDLNGRLLN